MRIGKIISGITLLLLMLQTQGCKHEPVIVLTAADSAICFERDILPIFVASCAKSGCHDPATAKEGVILNNWQGIMAAGVKPGDPSDSEVFEEIRGKMGGPRYGNLSSDQKILIQKWIMLGAKNTTNCPTDCDSTQFTFSGSIKPMIEKYCVGCHTYPNASGSVELSSHTGVAFVAKNGTLLNSLTHPTNWMPKGGKKLSDCEIKQFEKWINAGAKND
ncbi:MAG: hypothetical protein ACK5CL_05045 [Sphingomonadales bacterium]|jgi:hypothetical protein